MTPEQLRARADREERVYAAPDQAKMLRAGAHAMEERDRLRDAFAIAGPITLRAFAKHPFVLNPTEQTQVAIIKAALERGKQPADEDEWNDRYDAKWEVTK